MILIIRMPVMIGEKVSIKLVFDYQKGTSAKTGTQAFVRPMRQSFSRDYLLGTNMALASSIES